MTPVETTLFVLLITLATIVGLACLAAMIWSAIWVGRDARSRGLQTVWPLQVLMLVQFPWPLLTYWAFTRLSDRARLEVAAS